MSAAPGLTDTPAYHALASHVGEAGDSARADRGSLRGVRHRGAVSELVELRAWNDAVVEMMVRLVDEARDAGMTWQQIGDALGMTKQGVSQLHKRASSRA